MKKLISIVAFWMAMLPVMAQTTLLTESWETAAVGQTPPTGWGIDLVSGSGNTWFVQNGTHPSCYPYNGNRMVEFRSNDAATGVCNRLKRTVPLSSSGFPFVLIDFEWHTDSGYYYRNDKVEVQWSLNGNTWTTAGTYLRREISLPWKFEVLSLPAAAGNQATLYLAFLFTSDHGNNCHLDFVHVTGSTTAPPQPLVTTLPTSYHTSYVAYLYGSVIPNGYNTSTYFEYGLNTGYGLMIDAGIHSEINSVPIQSYITNLYAGQIYHYRAVATNATGTAYGNDLTFTTNDSVPTALTGSATAEATSVILTGIVDPGGEIAFPSFEYGLTSSYGSTISASPTSINGDSVNTFVFSTLSGLSTNTTYHYRLKAFNSLGTGYGSDATFTTSGSSLSTLITGQASNITQTSALLHGSVNPNGDQTYVTFEFGTTTAYGTFLSCGEFAGDTLQAVAQTLTGLIPGTLYHYRINGHNYYGTAVGADSTFTTSGSNVCQADFSVYPDSSYQYTYNFINQSTGNLVSWYWNFGDGNTSTLQFPPAHTYAAAGIYMVCLTVQGADSSCFDTHCDTLYVDSGTGCQAQYSHYPDSSAGNWSIQFIDLSSGNPTYWFWSFGDGTSSTLQNPVHTFGGPGNYYVCLTITGLNCTSTWCANVTVENTPACVSYFTFEKSGLTVNYSGHKVNGYPANYQWNFGDGLIGQGQNIIHQYASPGIYYVSLTTVEDSSGCQYSSAQSVSVGDSAEYHQIYGQVFAGNFPLTTGLALIFSIDTSNNYNPYIDVCYIDSLGIYYFPMVPLGNYVVYALPFDSNGYLPTYYGDVLYWENASVIFSGQPDNPYNIHLLPAGNRVNGNGNINGLINYGGMKSKLLDKITMQLMDSDGNMISFDRVSTQGDFIFPSLAFGTYFLKAEIAGIRSDAVQVLLSTESPEAVVHMTFSGNQIQGIPETWKLFEAGVIYPNPVSNLAHIAIVTKISIPIDIELFTVTGKVVYSARKISETGEMNLSIPVSSLPAGIYTLRIYSEKGTFITRKLLKTQ